MIQILTIFTMAAACDEIKTICKTICIQEGDESGLILNNKCYCINERDMEKVVFKINSNTRTNKQPEKKWFE